MSTLERRIAVCFILVLVSRISVGLAWHRCLSGNVDAVARIERTQRSLEGFESILSILKDAETVEYGYLITGKDRFLEPYKSARALLEAERQRLCEELSDSPSGVAALEVLSPLIDAKLAAMTETIAERGGEGFPDVERVVRTDRGKKLMERLQKTARELSSRERSLLTDQLRTLSSRSERVASFAVGLTILSVVVIAAVYRLLVRETRRQQRDLVGQNAVLDQLAKIDPLTGLPNRRHLDRCLAESFEASVADGSPLSLVVIDVDSFKSFNDTFGHPAGDDALRRLAAILRQAVRAPDVVARYGGEEFAVVLIGADATAATALAERLRVAVAHGEWPLRPITGSFGVATRDESTSDTARLVLDADRALYRSKAHGRNRVTHYRQLARSALDSMVLGSPTDLAVNVHEIPVGVQASYLPPSDSRQFAH